jgi:hypothetical protein
VGKADPAERAFRPAERRIDQVRVVDVRVLDEIRADDRDQDKQDYDRAARHRDLVALQPHPRDPAR